MGSSVEEATYRAEESAQDSKPANVAMVSNLHFELDCLSSGNYVFLVAPDIPVLRPAEKRKKRHGTGVAFAESKAKETFEGIWLVGCGRIPDLERS